MGKKPKFTEYYEMLEVEYDATPAQLKKAYYKQSKKLHPDRGGNAEDFKKMKDAYDVLNDPAKRKMYDRYGPDIFKMLEGNVEANAFAALAMISKRERLLGIVVISMIMAIILLFPILLSVRWDETNTYNWCVVFIPLWFVQGIMFVGQVLLGPSIEEPDEHDSDQEARDAHASLIAKVWVARVYLGIILVCFIVGEVFVALRLEETIDWSWYFVAIPFIVFEVAHIAYHIYAQPEIYAQEKATFDNPEVKIPKCTDLKYLAYMFNKKILWGLLRIVLYVLIAARANEDITSSWFVVFIPVYVGVGYKFFIFETPKPTVEEGQENEEANQPSSASRHVTNWLCTFAPLMIMVLVAAGKLNGGDYSSFAVWSPVFALFGFLWCILSCTICCISPEVMREAEEANATANGEQSSENKDNVASTTEEVHIDMNNAAIILE